MKFIILVLCLVLIFNVGFGYNYLGDPFISVEISPPIFVDVGETVQIPCLAFENIDGFSKIATSVVWHKENEQLSEHYYHEDGMLTIKNIQLTDSGIYVCQSETSEQFKRKISISVRDPLKIITLFTSSHKRSEDIKPITIQPPLFSGYAGDIVVLACFNSANTNASYVWNKNGTSPLASHIITRHGILIIQNASIEDSGRYICESFLTTGENETVSSEADVTILTNEFHGIKENTEVGLKGGVTEGQIENDTSTQTPMELEILTELAVIQYNDNQTTANIQANSEPVTTESPQQKSFQCSNGEFKCRNNECIEFSRICDGVRDCSEGEEEDNAHLCNLLIPFKILSGLPVNDNQTTKIQANNEPVTTETPKQKSSMPFILLPPLLTISPNSHEILNLNEGDQLILICSAEGNPFPRVQWTKSDGSLLQNDTSPNNIASVEIQHVSGSDSGKYTCHALNDAGTSEESINVLVKLEQSKIEADDTIETENSFECSAGEFTCRNGECIELSRICDGIRDCSEGEDEDDADLCNLPIDN